MAKATKTKRPYAPTVVHCPGKEPVEPQIDQIVAHDQQGPIIRLYAYDEKQLEVRKELFEFAEGVLNWGGTLSFDDLLLLKATARVLLLRGVTRGDFGACGLPLNRAAQPAQ